MKYFKASDKNQQTAFKNDVSDIVMEMINISTNIQYFADGKIVENPKVGYNVYETEHIDYEYCPCEGHVYLFTEDKAFSNAYLYRAIKEKYDQYMEEIASRFKEYPIIEVGYTGTTRYTLVLNDNTNFNKIAININQNKISKNTDSFQWYIHYMASNDDFYIPGIIYDRDASHRMDSLATIIYDAKNIYSLENAYRSSEYPLITDTTLYKNKCVVKDLMDISILYPRFTILCHFIKNSYMRKVSYTPGDIVNYQQDYHYKSKAIYYIKWQDVYQRKLTSIKLLYGGDLSKLPYHMSYTRAESLGLIAGSKKPESKSEDKSDELLNDNVDYYCAFSGLPIYEDCYVLDIYRHRQIVSIEEKDLLPTDVLYTPDRICEELIAGAFNITSNDPLNTIRVDTTDVQTTTKNKKSKADSKKKKENQKLVYRIVEYKEPVHLLISPAFMHGHIKFTTHHYWNLKFLEICSKFKFDAIIYRTYCPKTLSQTIESLPIDPITKEFINAFTQITAVQHNAVEKYTNFNVRQVQYNNKFYVLFKEFEFKLFHTTSGQDTKNYLFAAEQSNNYSQDNN
jgi:hypothetical protein